MRIPKRQSKIDNPDKLATKRKETTQHNVISVGHHYVQIDTNYVNKTFVILQTTGGKDEPNIVVCAERYINTIINQTIW